MNTIKRYFRALWPAPIKAKNRGYSSIALDTLTSRFDTFLRHHGSMQMANEHRVGALIDLTDEQGKHLQRLNSGLAKGLKEVSRLQIKVAELEDAATKDMIHPIEEIPTDLDRCKAQFDQDLSDRIDEAVEQVREEVAPKDLIKIIPEMEEVFDVPLFGTINYDGKGRRSWAPDRHSAMSAAKQAALSGEEWPVPK